MGKSETHKTENIQGKIDWVQVIFHQISWQDVFTKLLHINLDCIDCRPNSTLRHEEYDIVYSCGMIRYFTFENKARSFERGTLIMSGQACTMYEAIEQINESVSYVYSELFWRMLDYTTTHESQLEVRRLDLALDDYNKVPYFTIDFIQRKVARKQFLSKGRTTKTIDSEFDKKTRAKTQQIGARGSNCLFRFYEKAKELAKGLETEKQEEILQWAPQIRVETETRNEVAQSLFEAIAYLAKNQTLENLIRGFIQTELTFYTDSTYQQVCRWWQSFVKPQMVPVIRKKSIISPFDRTLNWFEFQGGLGVTQAIYFLIHNGIPLDTKLVAPNENYQWTQDLADKLIDYVTIQGRTDLIPIITKKIRKSSTTKSDDSLKR